MSTEPKEFTLARSTTAAANRAPFGSHAAEVTATGGVDWIPRSIFDEPVASFHSASDPPGRPAQQPPTPTSARGWARRHETKIGRASCREGVRLAEGAGHR